MHARLASAAILCLALAWAPSARGQNVAQPPSAGKESPLGAGVPHEPANLSGSPLQPVTVEHQGRLLVLTYGSKPGTGGLASSAGSRGEPPRFVIYQRRRQIASGQFEYGRSGVCSYSWRVPLTAFGDLRIVASARIDGAGPIEGQPVFFHWPWYWHLPRLGPWVLLALAIAGPRRNRHYEALLIFVPMLVVGLLWQTVTRTTGLPSDIAMQFSFLIEFLMVGMALLWLYADRLGRCGGLMRFVGSLGLVLLAGLVVVLSYGRTLAGAQGVILVFSTAALTMVLLVSLLLTRRLTRRRYRPLAFMVWLVAWCLLFSLAAVAAPAAVRMLAYPSRISDLGYIVSEIITPALVLGLGIYVINLPYLLLMFRSPFFRRRFRVWLGVESLMASLSR